MLTWGAETDPPKRMSCPSALDFLAQTKQHLYLQLTWTCTWTYPCQTNLAHTMSYDVSCLHGGRSWPLKKCCLAHRRLSRRACQPLHRNAASLTRLLPSSKQRRSCTCH